MVAEPRLPTQPLVELGRKAHIESSTVSATIIQVRIIVKTLREQRRCAKLLIEFIAQRQARERVGMLGLQQHWWILRVENVRVLFPSVVRAAQEIESRMVGFDGVEPKPACQDCPQVEVLQI